MALPTKLTSLAHVVYLHDKEHDLWFVLWSDAATYRLRYSIVGRLENFDSNVYVAVTVLPVNSDGSVGTAVPCYGLPQSGKYKPGGGYEIHITNVNSTATEVTNRVPGNILTGTYKGTIDFTADPPDWINWTLKSPSSVTHDTRPPVLEVCENATTNPVYPGGITCVEYERNSDGTVKLDSNGVPKVMTISGSSTAASNLKIGKLVLGFQQDFFGTGKHAWVGASGSSALPKPFDLTVGSSVDEDDNPIITLSVRPGFINGLMPSQMLTVFTIDDTSTWYVYLACVSDGYEVSTSTLTCSTTAPTQFFTTTQSTAPTSFNIMIGVITTALPYKIWAGNNIMAVPVQTLITEKSLPSPGLSPYVRWYSWYVAST